MICQLDKIINVIRKCKKLLNIFYIISFDCVDFCAFAILSFAPISTNIFNNTLFNTKKRLEIKFNAHVTNGRKRCYTFPKYNMLLPFEV